MNFVVVFETKARRDIRKEEEYQRHERGARGVRRWRELVLRARILLGDNPEGYPRAEEDGDLLIGLRELVVGKKRGTAHRFLFVIDGSRVLVLRIRQAAQDRLIEDDL